jgi:hypothetical protein
MKKVIFFLVFLSGISFAMNAQSTEKNKQSSTTSMDKMQLKDHVCTADCKDGKHVYVHGEKGHVCTADCKKMTSESEKMPNGSDKMVLKDHVCTVNCKDGKHVYLHGEKGHVCTADCKKM